MTAYSSKLFWKADFYVALRSLISRSELPRTHRSVRVIFIGVLSLFYMTSVRVHKQVGYRLKSRKLAADPS